METLWVPHGTLVFAPCKIKSTSDKDTTFLDDEGKPIVISSQLVPTLAKVHEAQLHGVENICTLDEVNQGALLHTVRVRYCKKQIYTRVARILVALNPFQAMPIYSFQYIEMYNKVADSMDLPPHVYGIGSDATNSLRTAGKNQAVLISGESGSGKTETTKLVLAYLAETVGGSGGIQDKIMQTNPVLEAFGNAMTVRNNNSSRFGKWLEMQVARSSMTIKSAQVTDYLLELTRVCAQGARERNYHIFFMIISSKGTDLLKDMKILGPAGYRYLRDAQFVAPGINDERCYEELVDAFNTLGFSRELQVDVFRIVVGILYLGNCEFQEKQNECELVSDAPLTDAAKCLCVDKELLRKPLISRNIVVGKEVTVKPLSVKEAVIACEGMSRLLYHRLFKWLIVKLNLTLSASGDERCNFAGVLDIAGFESFEQNSLEQLFINLSNEHLQMHFNNHVFKMELDDYKSEGVDVGEAMSFQDNSDIVALIDSKGGILHILDEELSVPKCSDMSFVSKALKAHAKHPRMVVPKMGGRPIFGIKHFAGEVLYTCDGFLDKNVDKPPDAAPSLLGASTIAILQEIGQTISNEVAEAGGGGGKKKPKTVAAGFRVSLAALIEKMNDAEPHFIRCVKPNVEKVPDKFTSKLCMEQLLFSGVMEAVRIRQNGYASRIPFREFMMRYRPIISKPQQKKIFRGAGEDIERVKAFLEVLPSALSSVGGVNPQAFRIGKTKVFAKTSAMVVIEKAKDMAVVGYAVDLQRFWKGVSVRKRMREVKTIRKDLATTVQKHSLYRSPGSAHTALAKLKTTDAIEAEAGKLKDMVAKAEQIPVKIPDLDSFRKIVHRMESEAKVIHHIHDMFVSIIPLEMQKVLARARELQLPQDGEVALLEERCNRLTTQIPLVAGLETVLKNGGIEEMEACMEEIYEADLERHPEKWIVELKGKELLGQVQIKLDQLKEEKRREELEAKRKKEEAEREVQRLKEEAEAAEKKRKKEEAEAKMRWEQMTAEKEAMDRKAAKQKDAAAAAEATAKAKQLADEQVAMEVAAKKASAAMLAKVAKLGMETKKAEEAVEVLKVKENTKKAEGAAEASKLETEAKQAEATMKRRAGLAIAAMKPGAGPLTFEVATQKLKRKTVTGKNLADQMQILLAMTAAAHEFDVETLEEQLSQCTQHGIRTKEQEAAQTLVNNLQTQAFVISTMMEWKVKVESEDCDKHALTVLKNLLDQARRIDVDEEILRNVAPVVQNGVRKRIRCTIRGSIFNNVNIEEMELAEGTFSQLANFQGLKSTSAWRGHRSSGWFFGSAPAGAAAMLVHDRHEMKDALTKIPPNKEATALQAYRTILGWMGDKPCPQSQRFGFSEEIVNISKSDPSLSDEIYVQLMKQLTANPSPRSVLQGWKLMLILTQHVSPSADLDEFLRAFLLTAISIRHGKDLVEVSDIAKRCVAEINILEVPERAIDEDEDLIPVHVLLIDNSSRKIYVLESETLANLRDKMLEQVKTSAGHEFAFFQVTDRLDVHRLLPDTTVVGTLFQKWRKLKKGTGRETRLLWKRRFLQIGEILRSGDMPHANLTYRQAVWDFLHYPISEDYRFICEISASIISVEISHYRDRLNKLADEGVLENLLPAHILANKSRGQWASMVAMEYKNLEESDHACGNKLQRMGRALSLMQRMKLFGAYFWCGHQTNKVHPEKVSIHDAPQKICILNAREPDAEYWICVDAFGVRFVSVDSAPGTEFQRGFLFNEEAMERVLRWGAKGNTVQFVVQTVDPASPTEGRVPMTISLLSPAAIDIAYAIYIICKGA